VPLVKKQPHRKTGRLPAYNPSTTHVGWSSSGGDATQPKAC